MQYRTIIKILGQLGLGIIVGATLFFHNDVTIREELPANQQQEIVMNNNVPTKKFGEEVRSMKTTIPFVKDNEIDYAVNICCKKCHESYKGFEFSKRKIITGTALALLTYIGVQ